MTWRREPDVQAAREPKRIPEVGWFLVVAIAALAPRIAFAHAFPTMPYSDFEGLLNFAIALNSPEWKEAERFWQFYGVGLPLGLSLVLRVVPGSPTDVARYATAVVTGLAAVSPFVIWRGAFGMATRVTAALLLGLWPSHIISSGVVAQDNWVMLPSVALAALAIRSMTLGEAWPLASAILFCAAGAVRQEMLVALLLPALAAAGAFRRDVPRARRLAEWAVATTACLLLLAGVRWAGSGRFRVGTEHPGLAVLGAATPGAGAGYWAFPQAYFAAYAPELEDQWEGMKQRSMSLAIRELAHRPFFHSVRMFSAGVNCVARIDSTIVFNAVGAPEALPPSHRARGRALVARITRVLDPIPLVVLGLFFGALLFGIGPRGPLFVLAAAILFKIGLHAVTVAQPRYFVVVGSLALMGTALAVAERGPAARRWRMTGAVVAGLLLAFVAGRLGGLAETYVLTHDEQLTYRFTVWDRVHPPRLKCTMSTGLLSLHLAVATIRPLRPDPAPGEGAIAECRLDGSSPATPVALEIRDAYPWGGYPGRIVQLVTVDGVEVLRGDIAAEPGVGWKRVPLVNDRGESATNVDVSVRVQADRPQAGERWGLAASTTFRLVPLTAPPDPGH
jgi:hypothetical protein